MALDLQRAREILGPEAEGLTDDEVVVMRECAREIAAAVYREMQREARAARPQGRRHRKLRAVDSARRP